MFLSSFIIGIWYFGSVHFEKIKLPKLILYLILWILMSPSVLNIADPTLIYISGYLRQISLVIILTRAGLTLDIRKLIK